MPAVVKKRSRLTSRLINLNNMKKWKAGIILQIAESLFQG